MFWWHTYVLSDIQYIDFHHNSQHHLYLKHFVTKLQLKEVSCCKRGNENYPSLNQKANHANHTALTSCLGHVTTLPIEVIIDFHNVFPEITTALHCQLWPKEIKETENTASCILLFHDLCDRYLLFLHLDRTVMQSQKLGEQTRGRWAVNDLEADSKSGLCYSLTVYGFPCSVMWAITVHVLLCCWHGL